MQERLDHFFGCAQWILVVAICVVAAGLLFICQLPGKLLSLVRRTPEDEDDVDLERANNVVPLRRR
jgi:hypothetical protein